MSNLTLCRLASRFTSSIIGRPPLTPVSISDNQIAFIILAKDKKRQKEVQEALHEYTRSHLEIYD
jgi:hypothetical protein